MPGISNSGMGDKSRSLIRDTRFRTILWFLLIFTSLATVSVLIHRQDGRFNWYSTIFSDKAGYYIYLPATLFFDFNPDKCPVRMDEKTGYGFYLDYSKHKIQTQYFYGVSFMLSPFFMAAHGISKIYGIDEEGGFSQLYHDAADVAGVFYLTLGLFFLFYFLKFYFRRPTIFVILTIIFLGTNLFDYGLSDTLMSHVYSFAAISIFLCFMRLFLSNNSSYLVFLIMCLSFAILTVVRPTNVLIGLAYLFWDLKSWKEIPERLKRFFVPRYILVFLLIMILFIIPQLVYFKYLNGSYFTVVYGSGFTNWAHPLFAEVLFSPLNGLFLFNPVLLFFVAGVMIMIAGRMPNGWFILGIFLTVTYLAAAYSYWYYGCSSGHRAYVEFYPLFAIAVGVFFERIRLLRNLFIRTAIYLCILVTVYFNLRMSIAVMTHSVEKCFTGSTWDWDHYITNLDLAGIWKPSKLPQSFTNDFENGEIFRGYLITYDLFHSRGRSMKFDTTKPADCHYRKKFNEFRDFQPAMAKTSVWCWSADSLKTYAMLVCSIEKDGKSIVWQSVPIDQKTRTARTWFKVSTDFKIPPVSDGETLLQFYVWNPAKKVFYLDDFKIIFE